MKKSAIVVLFFLFVLSQLPSLSITPTSWDLGTISNVKDKQTLKLEILNDTSKEIKIDFISTCDCFYSSIDSLTLQPEESAQLKFYFDL